MKRSSRSAVVATVAALVLVAGGLSAEEPAASPAGDAAAGEAQPGVPAQLDAACSAAFELAYKGKMAPPLATASIEDRKKHYSDLLNAVPVPEVCLRAFDEQLARSVQLNSSDLARSFDAAASNPSSLALLEGASVVDAAALAIRTGNFVSADESAVTVNLGAAAAFCSRNPFCGWDRLAGSVTFGAKVPEKEIVGFSGVPDPDKLFDVLVWDVKLRLVGDRRPAAPTWRDIRARTAKDGWLYLKRANLSMFPEGLSNEAVAQELALVQDILQQRGKADLDAVQREIGSSLLISAKFSGQHLTEQAGMNKYSGTLLLEKGIGGAGLTFNATYSAAQDVMLDPANPAVTLKTVDLALGLSGDFMKGALVSSRSTEWSLAGRLTVPADGEEVPVERERVHFAALELRFPVSESTQIPVSVTFTNDPNSLTKQKYLRGQVGINYDFGALTKLLTGGQ